MHDGMLLARVGGLPDAWQRVSEAGLPGESSLGSQMAGRGVFSCFAVRPGVGGGGGWQILCSSQKVARAAVWSPPPPHSLWPLVGVETATPDRTEPVTASPARHGS